MTPEQRRQCRAIGGRLAVYIRQQGSQWPATQTLQAVAADLAAGNSELVLPLKDLVTRPAFQYLAAKAGSGGGSVERHALLQDMQATFAPSVIDALAEVLASFLDLPSETALQQIAQKDRIKPPPTPFSHPSPEQPPVPIQPQPPVPQPPPAPPGHRLSKLLGIAAVTAVGAASVGVLIRIPPFCVQLGLCPAQQGPTATQQALMAATNAEQELRRAQSLEEYRRAVEQLERELLKLSGDTLTPEQQSQRDQLQITAQQGRTTLAQEEADLARLERASQALNNAEERSGEERAAQLSAARQELDGVLPRSFSAAEASRLRERLDALASSPGSPEAEAIPPSQDRGPAEAEQQPQRSWSPPPAPPARQLPQPSAPGGGAGSTPYREQPLF